MGGTAVITVQRSVNASAVSLALADTTAINRATARGASLDVPTAVDMSTLTVQKLTDTVVRFTEFELLAPTFEIWI